MDELQVSADSSLLKTWLRGKNVTSSQEVQCSLTEYQGQKEKRTAPVLMARNRLLDEHGKLVVLEW